MTIIANVGALAIYLLFIWLASAIVSAYMSERKGYGEKLGLASGLLLSLLGVVIWLAVPAKQESVWRVDGALPKRRQT